MVGCLLCGVEVASAEPSAAQTSCGQALSSTPLSLLSLLILYRETVNMYKLVRSRPLAAALGAAKVSQSAFIIKAGHMNADLQG